MAEEKDDFIGKRVNDVRKIFGMAERDFMALMLIISVLGNIALIYLLLAQSSDLNNEIKAEIRRQVDPAVESKVSTELPKQLNEAVQPMKEGVEQGMQKLDTVLNKVINKE
jgi:hypothetical protein